MHDLELTSTAVDTNSVTVGYRCPCGCTPAVTYGRGRQTVTEGCCCGNEMAVGPDAANHIKVQDGYEFRAAFVTSPWSEQLPVVLAIGPSTHPETDLHSHDPHEPAADLDSAIDPVCGMTVDVARASGKELHARYLEADYHFCSRGCKLDFLEGPDQYLAPDHVPSM